MVNIVSKILFFIFWSIYNSPIEGRGREGRRRDQRKGSEDRAGGKKLRRRGGEIRGERRGEKEESRTGERTTCEKRTVEIRNK